MGFKMSPDIPTVSLDITRRRSEYIANKQAEDENAEEDGKPWTVQSINCVGVA